jgi:membrane protein
VDGSRVVAGHGWDKWAAFRSGHWQQNLGRRWQATRTLSGVVGRELLRTRALDVAAGLAFWSMMSLIPLLMMVVSIVALLHLPNLIPELLSVLAMLVPPSALTMVEKMVGTLLTPHRGVLSFGVLSYLWSSTGAFTALISALDIAYDVKKERSWVRDRLQAILLTFTSGGLLTISLLMLLAGPGFAHFLNNFVALPGLEKLWPVIRYGSVFICFVLALELAYFLGPNRRQRFKDTLPGALFAIVVWFVGSAGLAFYLDHLSNLDKLYGGMGAVLALMFWIYLIALATLAGAELNAELQKRWESLRRGSAGAPEMAKAA